MGDVGTAEYKSPEIIANKKHNSKTDIWFQMHLNQSRQIHI